MFKDPYSYYQPQHPVLLGFHAGGKSHNKGSTEAAKKRLEEERRLNKACVRSEPDVPDKKPKKPFICVTGTCKKKFKDDTEAYEAAVKDHAEWSSSECTESRKQAAKKKEAKNKKAKVLKEYDDAVETLIRSNEDLMPKWMSEGLSYGNKLKKLKAAIKKLGKFQLSTVNKIYAALNVVDDNGAGGEGTQLLQDAIKEVIEELTPLAEAKRDKCLNPPENNYQLPDVFGPKCSNDGGRTAMSVEEFLLLM